MPVREEIVEEGIVESVSNGMAVIRLIKKGNCEDCSAKILCSSNTDKNTLSAKDPYGVMKGDFVRISVPGKNLSLISTLMYGIPLVLLIAGILIGNILFKYNTELYSAILSLFLVVLYGGIFYFYLKRRDYSSVFPRIIFVKK